MPDKKPKLIADNDIESSRKALFRASQKAREVAKKTGTPIVVFKNGRVEKEHVS